MIGTWNRDVVAELLLEAGRKALTYFGDAGITVKADKSLVTEADKAIERDLARHFDHPDQGVYLLGEETFETYPQQYFEAALEKITWIVDPIDGTSSFAFGLPTWGVSIGYSEGGTLREGGILIPVFKEMMITDRGSVYHARFSGPPETWSTTSLQRFAPEPQDPKRLGLVSISQEVAKHGLYRGPQSVQATGSCVYSCVRVMRGSFLGHIGHVKLWDIAAAIALFDALGFTMKFSDGRAIGCEINARNYSLDNKTGTHWKMADHCFIADSEQLCDYLISRTEVIPPAPTHG